MASHHDPLFRNGLEHYRKTAPASVWDRVEAGLDHKRRKSVLFKVAAGLILLIATSTVLWQYDHNGTPETEEFASSQLSAISYQSPGISQQPSASSHQSSLNENLELSPSSSIVERSRNEHLKSSNQSSVGSQQLAVGSNQSSVSSNQFSVNSIQSEGGNPKTFTSSDETQPITLMEPEEIITEPTPLNPIVGSANDVVAEQKGTSITYTSDEVNEKFLKKELIADATPEKKNASGLQKVIDKALDLTNEGTVYSELREKKNEWLSFNILSNKTETNK